MKRPQRRQYGRACRGKKAYKTIKQALFDARELRRKSGDDISAYVCDFCGRYHVGHTPWWVRPTRQ